VFVYTSEKNTGNRPIGVIGALVAGFDRVAAQPYLLLPTVLLDLFLWFGPHLVIPAIIQLASSSLTRSSMLQPATTCSAQSARCRLECRST